MRMRKGKGVVVVKETSRHSRAAEALAPREPHL
jgi:hypothetical protein